MKMNIDVTWNKRFKEMKEGLDDFKMNKDNAQSEGLESLEKENTTDRIVEKENNVLADSRESLAAEVSPAGDEVEVTYANIEQIIVSYYVLDLEIVFSLDPFFTKNAENFTFVSPNSQKIIETE